MRADRAEAMELFEHWRAAGTPLDAYAEVMCTVTIRGRAHGTLRKVLGFDAIVGDGGCFIVLPLDLIAAAEDLIIQRSESGALIAARIQECKVLLSDFELGGAPPN